MAEYPYIEPKILEVHLQINVSSKEEALKSLEVLASKIGSGWHENGLLLDGEWQDEELDPMSGGDWA